MNEKETRQIEAYFNDSSIIVYQAFNECIAQQAVEKQNFLIEGFKASRMTWIKPSFYWMMHRSGWASKVGQTNILAVTISREGFDWALERGCLSHFDSSIHLSPEVWHDQLLNSPVRIQWDPGRDLDLRPLPQKRAIQIGLTGTAVLYYMHEWITQIDDITSHCHRLKSEIDIGKHDSIFPLISLNSLRSYPVHKEVQHRLGMIN